MKTQNDLVKELFSYLDIIEVSDSGREFHPIHISCIRSCLVDKVNNCLNQLKDSLNVS